MFSILPKKSKQSHFFCVFESNRNNSKNTLEVIASLNTLKDISISVTRTLNHNISNATNPTEIVNIFNNHYAAEAEKTRTNINY